MDYMGVSERRWKTILSLPSMDRFYTHITDVSERANKGITSSFPPKQRVPFIT